MGQLFYHHTSRQQAEQHAPTIFFGQSIKTIFRRGHFFSKNSCIMGRHALSGNIKYLIAFFAISPSEKSPPHSTSFRVRPSTDKSRAMATPSSSLRKSPRAVPPRSTSTPTSLATSSTSISIPVLLVRWCPARTSSGSSPHPCKLQFYKFLKNGECCVVTTRHSLLFHYTAPSDR